MKKREDLKQINVRIAPELLEFIEEYARENYKTVTGMIRDIIHNLYKENKDRIAVDENGKVILNKK